MEQLINNFKIEINEKLFIKDPTSSDLGNRILQYSILLINEIGFEQFTFKKLGLEIGSNESSVYRYFENKHKLLLYLTSWYWGWMECNLVIKTLPIYEPVDKLDLAIEIITGEIIEDSNYHYINEEVLQKIIIAEYSKSYLTKEVDIENKEGYFVIYKRLVKRLSDMILSVNKNYPYALALSSNLIEGALHQHFLRDHFTAITDCNKDVSPAQFFKHLVLNNIKTSHGE